MAQKIITQSIELTRQDGRDTLLWPDVLAVKGDSHAHQWRVELYSGGHPSVLTGQTAMCYVVNGGNSVPLNATIEGNTARVSFPSACYAHVGTMCCMMSVGASGQAPTVAMMCLRVRDGITDVIIDPNDIVPSLNALLALVAELADAATAEAARILAEQARVTAETARQTKETQRQSAETARGTAETARQANETQRQSAETARGTAESGRVTAEQGRVTAEGIRQTKETQRQSAETARGTAEGTRQTNETQRQSAETARSTAESGRVQAEALRVGHEDNRITAESARHTAEQMRQLNETARNTKLGNLSFDVEMIAPSGDPHADVTQDADSIDVMLYVPTSNLAYATFEIDAEGDLYMVTPEGFDDISFSITDDDELAVIIN